MLLPRTLVTDITSFFTRWTFESEMKAGECHAANQTHIQGSYVGYVTHATTARQSAHVPSAHTHERAAI